MEYELGGLFQAWLVESWASHASLASAKAYYWQVDEQGDEPEAITLLLQPQGGHREVAVAVTSALYTALVAQGPPVERAAPRNATCRVVGTVRALGQPARSRERALTDIRTGRGAE